MVVNFRRLCIYVLVNCITFMATIVPLMLLLILLNKRGRWNERGWQLDDQGWPLCRPLYYLEFPRPVTALASAPGSGSVWLRDMLQQMSGVYTGSVEIDRSLLERGFPAEGVSNGSVVVVKTHEWGEAARRPFARAVLLVRSPRHAILADFHRQMAGRSNLAPMKIFSRFNIYWKDFVRKKLEMWRTFYLDWALKFEGPMLIVYYEALLSDPGRQMRAVMRFLGLETPEYALQCALVLRSNIFKGPRMELAQYTSTMKQRILRVQKMVLKELHRAHPSPDNLDTPAAIIRRKEIHTMLLR